MNAGQIVPAEVIFQYSDNLGIFEKRKIEMVYAQQKYNVLKTPWTTSDLRQDIGFFCGKCGDELNSAIQKQVGAEDFIKSHGLKDIRKKYVNSANFHVDDILDSVIGNYSENDIKLYIENEKVGNFVEIPEEVNKTVKTLLNDNFGISQLYEHQAETIIKVLNGNDVILETSTASGKSLGYNIPIICKLIENPNYRFLYLSPSKALAVDQMRMITKFGKNAKGQKVSDAIREFFIEDNDFVLDEEIAGKKITLVKFDSEINQHDRNKAIESGNIFYSTPDKIHATILQFNNHNYKQQGRIIKWTNFFKNLKYVVIDEIHTYKGVFGANVAYVIRRLQRLCEQNGNTELQFISCSATIDNPKELADAITGRNNLWFFVTLSG